VSDGSFSYYESDKNSNPNGALRANEIVCLAVDSPERHGYTHTYTQRHTHIHTYTHTHTHTDTHTHTHSFIFQAVHEDNKSKYVPLSSSLCVSPPPLSSSLRYDHTFELYSESERLYLFGTDDPDSHKEWVKSIAMVTTKHLVILLRGPPAVGEL